jgi:MFS family permease
MVLAGALVAPTLLKRRWPNQPFAFQPVWFAVLALLVVWQHDWFLGVIAMREGGWSVLIPVVVAAIGVGSIVWALREGGATQPIDYYLSAAWAGIGLGSLMQYYPMGDCWHIFFALGPVFGVVVYAAWAWSGWRAPVVAAVFAVVLLPAAYFRVKLIPPALNRPLVTLTKPVLLRGMKVPPEQARYLDQITDTLALAERARPDVPAVLIGNDALYLGFLKNLENPVPYYVTWMGLADQETNVARWGYINRVRPVLILEKPRWGSSWKSRCRGR